MQDGEIVLQGENHWPEGSMEFKRALHLDSSGLLKDTFTRKEKGGWMLGHEQEFVAREQAR